MLVYVEQIDGTDDFSRFFKVFITLSVEIPSTLDVSRMPLALAAIAIIFSSILGFEPS
jgi:hypothetical protein